MNQEISLAVKIEGFGLKYLFLIYLYLTVVTHSRIDEVVGESP